MKHPLPLALSAAAAVLACAAVPAAAQNNAGAQVFTICKTCHSVEPGRNGVGPSLAGVVGRRSGSAPGYNYSPAMRKAGLTWDAKTLDVFLTAPSRKVPGTKMPISIADPAKRAAVIAYLAAHRGK